ncbi:hypothetical protein [Mycolicibacterium sediminis]|uniref:Lipoprotein n=1 Tax=Mycolicibacterium sediminis TaxID=1286180 RepID=A0A7I7QJJ9_9MYCO|nr:hypothetical protein [Mycolicibacterium sediminis]BBY26247.1 hypothetical protein MSEDJ_03430 [Mycolicibacterium sediminis]
MTRIRSMIGRAALCVASLSLLAACSTDSPPDLPPASDSRAIAEAVQGPDGRVFLDDIIAYPWQDGGRDAGARFDWIGEDATSSDHDDAARAADTAHALAAFLAENRTAVSAAPPNPAVFEALSRSLVPFVGALVGDPGTTPAFRPLDDVGGSMSQTAALFATMIGREATTATFVDVASDRADADERAFAGAAASNPSTITAEYLGGLLRAARLRGLLTAGSTLADPNAPEPTLLAARTQNAYAVAAAMVPPNEPSIERAFFGPTGELLGPERIPSAQWSQYDAQLRQYLAAYPAITDALQQFDTTFRRIADQ